MTAYILTLIAPAQTQVLNTPYVDSLSKELPRVSKTNWLSPEEACEVGFTCLEPDDLVRLETYLRGCIGADPIDIAIRRADEPRKKLLIADMDSTIIQQECIDEIADFANVKDQVAHITEQAMQGELDFEDALKERVALLRGLDVATLETVVNERIHLTPGARTLVQTMRHHGAYCALVSGGFTFFTSQIAGRAGFHIDQANRLEMDNETLTGHVIEPILGRDAKRDALERFCAERTIDIQDSLAVGDGANDLAMIGAAGLGVAFHAKPIVAKQSDVRIDYGDLTALLYIQGYHRREFVTE